jgi:cyanate permease
MEDQKNLSDKSINLSLVAFFICVAIMVGSVVVASLVQRDFGRVEVTNVIYENYNGIPVSRLF